MAQQIADRRDIDFVLHEMLNVEELSNNEKYQDFNRKTIDLIVSEARNLAIKEMLPTQVIGDRQGVSFENGSVKVPAEFKKLYETYKEGEWVAMTESLEWGGARGDSEDVAAHGQGDLYGDRYGFFLVVLFLSGPVSTLLAGAQQQQAGGRRRASAM